MITRNLHNFYSFLYHNFFLNVIDFSVVHTLFLPPLLLPPSPPIPLVVGVVTVIMTDYCILIIIDYYFENIQSLRLLDCLSGLVFVTVVCILI